MADADHRPAGLADVATYHPTFLYEALWNLALAAALVWVGHRWHPRVGPALRRLRGGPRGLAPGRRGACPSVGTIGRRRPSAPGSASTSWSPAWSPKDDPEEQTVTSALWSAVVLAQSDDRWWGDHMSGWGGGWMWLWGTIMMLTWVVLVGAAVWFVARSLGGDRRSRAREILEERYARGELTTEEYRERLDQIG